MHLAELDGRSLQKLRILNVSGNRLSTLRDLPTLPALERLYACGNQVSSLDCLASLAAKVPRVRALYLQEPGGNGANPVCHDDDYAAAATAALPALTTLDGTVLNGDGDGGDSGEVAAAGGVTAFVRRALQDMRRSDEEAHARSLRADDTAGAGVGWYADDELAFDEYGSVGDGGIGDDSEDGGDGAAHERRMAAVESRLHECAAKSDVLIADADAKIAAASAAAATAVDAAAAEVRAAKVASIIADAEAI